MGIAPRSWIDAAAGIAWFTEKSRPPGNFTPGTVNRYIYTFPLKGSGLTRIFRMGHILSDPVVDPVRRVVYAQQRIKDTNGDGTVDGRDRASLWRITASGYAASKLPLNWPPLAVSRKGTLVAGDGRRLFLLPLRAPAAIPLPSPPDKVTRVWFDGEKTLKILTPSGKIFELGKGAFMETKTVHNLPDGMRIVRSGTMRYLTRKREDWRFPLVAGRTVWLPLSPLQRNYMLLLRIRPNPAIFAAAMIQKQWNRLLSLPKNTTRIAVSRNRRSILYLTTWDRDRDRRLHPGGLDKSALSVIHIRPEQK